MPSRDTLRALSWLPPLAWLGLMVPLGAAWQPWQRLLITTVGLFVAVKVTVLLRWRQAGAAREGGPARLSSSGLLTFLLVWPGMDPEPFRSGRPVAARPGVPLAGLLRMSAGLLANAALVAAAPKLPEAALGLLGILALLLAVHLGFSDVLTAAVRRAGWPVGRLFDAPWRSRSLSEFWSRRWNLAFVEMDRLLFLRPLRRRFGAAGTAFGVFLISGLLHELAISYPALRGWGGPMAYFALHGLLVAAEAGPLQARRWPALAGRLWTWLWVLAPLPVLFHAPFRASLVVPLYRGLHSLLLLR